MTWFMFFATLLFSVCFASYPGRAASISEEVYWDCSRSVDAQGLRETISYLSGVGSRVTGYPGAARAAAYIYDRLQRLGVEDLTIKAFDVPIPVDEGAVLELLPGGETVPIYALWPNLVRTSTLPPGGIEGPLIYAGSGEYAAFNGLEVEGSMVLMEFNSQMNWLNAFNLGARAVIFIEPTTSHRMEAEQKFLTIPADLPRFYIAADRGAYLRKMIEQGDVRVRLGAKMPWRKAEGQTIVGFIQGSDPERRTSAVVLEAYYDALSVVPGIAPGAEQSCGVAAFLEVVRALTEHRPRRSVIVVATSGHFEDLHGIRDLVRLMRAHPEDLEAAVERSSDPKDQEQLKADLELLKRFRTYTIDLFIGLDLTSQTNALGVYQAGAPYRVRSLSPPMQSVVLRYTEAYEARAYGGEKILANGLKRTEDRVDLGGMPQVTPFDGAAVALEGTLALTFATINDDRALFDTPVDWMDRVRFGYLTEQVRFLTYLIPALINDPDAAVDKKGKDCFGTLRGEVVRLGPRSYLPDVPVAHAVVRARLRNKTLAAVRGDFLTIADERGHFEIPGMEARIIYTQPVAVEAYGLDEESGAITYAPDLGIEGKMKYPTDVLMDLLERPITLVAFRCDGTTLFDIVDQRYFFTLDNVYLLDAQQEAEPMSFGACLPLTPSEVSLFGYTNHLGSLVEPCAVVFARPDSKIKVTMTTGVYGLGRRLLLLFSDPEHPEGRGFDISAHRTIPFTSYQVALDTYLLNASRITKLRRHGVENQRLNELHRQTGEALERASTALKERRYDAYMDAARMAWGYASRAYGDVQHTINDTVYGVLFFLALLIPFSYFGERLLFAFPDIRKQVLATFGIFLLVFAAIRTAHPAFELSISPMIILLGFIIFTLSVIVIAIGISKLNEQIKRSLSHRVAAHRADVNRRGTFFTALMLGISHMRRRTMRTLLTCATIVLMTFSVLSFTSIKSLMRFNRTPRGPGARYDGMLLRMPGWKTIEFSVYEILRNRYGDDHVAPRAWRSGQKTITLDRIDEPHLHVAIDGALGLTPQETQVTRPQEALIAGRWFQPGDTQRCILPSGLAERLHIDRADVGTVRLRMLGEAFTVIGIVDNGLFNAIRDLNDEAITPLDPEAQQPQEKQIGISKSGRAPVYIHAFVDGIAILPYDVVMKGGGDKNGLKSIAVRFSRPEDVEAELDRLMPVLGLNVFVGIEGERYLVNSVGMKGFGGQQNVIVPVLIVALIVLNTMMGAVYERISEIGTLNAIGLAPIHIAGLFMAESCVYATLGGVMGYMTGQVAAKVITSYDLLSGLTLNYSSLSAVMTMLIVMGVVMASTLYPARKAAQISVPGIERTWRLPEPEGDVLAMELPFTLHRNDAVGVSAFLREYFEAHGEQSIGAGFYTEWTDLMEQTGGLGDKETRRQGDKGTRGGGIRLDFAVWLAPFDQGINQEVRLISAPTEDPRIFSIMLYVRRLSGNLSAWRRGNYTFVNDIRKQFLVWRALRPEDRAFYVQEVEG